MRGGVPPWERKDVRCAHCFLKAQSCHVDGAADSLFLNTFKQQEKPAPFPTPAQRRVAAYAAIGAPPISFESFKNEIHSGQGSAQFYPSLSRIKYPREPRSQGT